MAIIFATRTAAGDPLNFRLVRGTRWDDDVILTDQVSGDPVDLTGISGLIMRVRESIDSDDVLLELSVANTRLVVLDAAAGRFGIRIGSALSHDSFPENDHLSATYVYDVVIERTDDEYEAAISGKVVVLPQVTRPLDA